MRIALIHNQFIRSGGMERYLFDLVNGFADAGHQVTVICYKVDEPAPLSDKCEVIRHDFELIPKPLRRHFFDRAVRRTLRELSFDLTIALPEIQNADLAICGGTHQAFLSYLKLQPNRLDKAQIKLETKSYKSARTVIAHSPMLKDELQRLYGLPESQVEVVLPPTDNQSFQRAPDELRKEYKRRFEIKDNVTTILLCSTGHQRKGLGPLMQALILLPTDEFELVVAGSKVDELTRPDAPTNVRELGYVSEMAKLYNAVDITALPALYEPFGLVVVESLQCGTPVLLSGAVGAGTLMSGNDGVILGAVSPQAIAEGLQDLRNNPRTVTEDFANTHRLTINAHIKSLLDLHQRAKQSHA